ncbi:MAG: molybdenum cofactor guanylyltransferase MobA [Pararhodobacter sp.]|nr:molybdenum cofactor guanylyltransferase MobA [Pararhodobacter sp.]
MDSITESQSEKDNARPCPPGVILAGGLASRMGGGDKGLLLLGGRRLVDHVIERLAPQVGALAINANGDPARLADLGLPVIGDSLPDRPGPLAGVLASMEWAAAMGAGSVITVAADTPFLPGDLVARLEAAAAGSPSGLALAASPDASGKVRRHPTCGLWPVSLRTALRRDVQQGERRAGRWADAHGAALALFDSARGDPFFNINTPDDLARAEAMAGAAQPRRIR